MPRESALCACIGWSAPSMRHSIWRDAAIDTAEVFSAISVAISRARGSSASGSTISRTRPASSASAASNTRPVNTHSSARLIPTTRGRNQLEQASGTSPRRANTNPKRALVEAIRMSMGSSMVTPTPTAGPFTAAMTGLRDSKMRSVSNPPPSR